MDILVVTGNQIIPRKLESKIAPLLALEQVRRVYLVGASRYNHPKVRSFHLDRRSGMRPFMVHAWKVLTVLTVLMRYDPAIVVTVGLIPHGIYTLILATLFKRKKIFLSMGMNDLVYSDTGWFASVLRKIAFLSDWIGTRGTYSKERLVRSGFKAERIFVPHNVFDFNSFKPIVCEKIYDLIYVGLLEPYKRVDLLLETVRRLVFEKGMKQIRLAIVGGGRLKGDLQRRSQALGVREHVHFLPPGDENYVCRLLNQSKIFVMTSQREGLPMAMIEAMSCGLPVVAFDHADVGDVVYDAENGLLVPPGNLDEFVSSVWRILGDRGLQDKLSRGAFAVRERFQKTYSLEAVKDVWEGIFLDRQGRRRTV